MTHAEIVSRAFEAFSEEAGEPPPLPLRGANDVDSYDVPQPFDASMDAVTDEYLERHAFWGLPHLDPRSWKHYLPHLIDYALRRRDDPAMVTEALVRSLRPPDRYPPRLGSLTDEQEAAVRSFLEALVVIDVAMGTPDDAEQALEEWFRPNPRSRPSPEEVAALRSAPTAFRDVAEDVYRLRVPDTLSASGLRDIPSESRRVQTWGGYLCGDVHAVVALNVISRADRSFADTIARYSEFFALTAPARSVTVPGARRASRLDGLTRVVSSAGPENLIILVADAGDIVTLTIRAAERNDVRTVMDQIAASFEVSAVP